MSERTEILTKIWRQVLGRPDLDENSDLLDNDGTSLHMLQIVGEVHRTLGVDVKLREVFTHTSPRSLSDFLEGKPGRESADSHDISA
ncbi:acyl carrier protein [Kitasatospora sp. NPDC052868]|uniref:acyl carrier protein n=1 Tax=Kitasatospora sp. NPDC052868 TaxID=3364060 RepID=UPI0037CB26FD